MCHCLPSGGGNVAIDPGGRSPGACGVAPGSLPVISWVVDAPLPPLWGRQCAIDSRRRGLRGLWCCPGIAAGHFVGGRCAVPPFWGRQCASTTGRRGFPAAVALPLDRGRLGGAVAGCGIASRRWRPGSRYQAAGEAGTIGGAKDRRPLPGSSLPGDRRSRESGRPAQVTEQFRRDAGQHVASSGGYVPERPRPGRSPSRAFIT